MAYMFGEFLLIAITFMLLANGDGDIAIMKEKAVLVLKMIFGHNN